METKNKIFIVSIFLILILIINSFLIGFLLKGNKIIEQEKQIIALNLYYKFYSMELIDSFTPSLINGINTYSDTDFKQIKEYYEILNITNQNYPGLQIFFFRNINICNGIVEFDTKKIYIYSCNKNMNVRNYFTTPEDWELSTLGHELGHYNDYLKGDYNLMGDEYRQDDYSYNLTKKGVKLG